MTGETDEIKLNSLAAKAHDTETVKRNADTLVRILDIETKRRNNMSEEACFLSLVHPRWADVPRLTTDLGTVHTEEWRATHQAECKGVDRMLQELKEIDIVLEATEPEKPATARPAADAQLDAYLNIKDTHDKWTQNRTAGFNLTTG